MAGNAETRNRGQWVHFNHLYFVLTRCVTYVLGRLLLRVVVRQVAGRVSFLHQNSGGCQERCYRRWSPAGLSEGQGRRRRRRRRDQI